MVVLAVAAIVASLAGAVARRVPAFDPAAPRASERAIAAEVQSEPRLRAFLRTRVDPDAATGLALTVALSLLVATVVTTGLLLIMAQHNAGLARYDLSAARWGASHATNGSTRFLRDVSLLGGTPIIVAVACVVAVFAYWRSRTWSVFAFMATVVVSESVIVALTKWIVGRARPDIDRLTGFSGSSFPSGHAAAAAATFSAAALLIGRGCSPRAKACLAALAAGLAAAVASTRVLLGVHWFTDVLAGLAVGWACFALASIAFGGRVLRFGHPVDVAERIADVSPARR